MRRRSAPWRDSSPGADRDRARPARRRRPARPVYVAANRAASRGFTLSPQFQPKPWATMCAWAGAISSPAPKQATASEATNSTKPQRPSGSDRIRAILVEALEADAVRSYTRRPRSTPPPTGRRRSPCRSSPRRDCWRAHACSSLHCARRVEVEEIRRQRGAQDADGQEPEPAGVVRAAAQARIPRRPRRAAAARESPPR